MLITCLLLDLYPFCTVIAIHIWFSKLNITFKFQNKRKPFLKSQNLTIYLKDNIFFF